MSRLILFEDRQQSTNEKRMSGSMRTSNMRRIVSIKIRVDGGERRERREKRDGWNYQIITG